MPISAALRRRVLERAADRCEYCRIVAWPLTVDHVRPRSVRSRAPIEDDVSVRDLDDPANLAAACGPFNRAKWNVTTAEDPLTGHRHPLFNPREHAWEEHFGWEEDFLRIVGLTPIGRATVRQLQLNRTIYQQQRRILLAAGRGGAPPWS